MTAEPDSSAPPGPRRDGGDEHGHDHRHGHAHGHHHGGVAFGRAFAIGIALNTVFIGAEIVAGVLANSTALIADAGHNISDVLGLVIAWLAAWLATRPPSQRYTYGLGSSSILAAQINALLLLVAVGVIVMEAISHFADPRPVTTSTVIIVAALGIAVNGATAALFLRGSASDLNIRGAFLHMVADAAVSAGVVVSAVAIALTGWFWIDPAVSLVIAAIIVWSTWGLLRDSVAMSLGAAPGMLDLTEIRAYLLSRPGVVGLHDLHVWSLSTTEAALTCHLTMPAGAPGDSFVLGVAEELRQRFGIGHATLQIEQGDAAACVLAERHPL